MQDSYEMTPSKERAGYVYFLYDPLRDLVKIGRTSRLMKRFNEHNRNFKFEIIQVLYSDNCFKTEHLLHKYYKDHQVESEKFRLTREEIIHIKKLKFDETIVESLSDNNFNKRRSLFLNVITERTKQFMRNNFNINQVFGESDTNDCENYIEEELFVLRKLIYEPDQRGEELTETYIEFVEQVMFMSAYWNQAGLNQIGVDFKRFLEEKVLAIEEIHDVSLGN